MSTSYMRISILHGMSEPLEEIYMSCVLRLRLESRGPTKQKGVRIDYVEVTTIVAAVSSTLTKSGHFLRTPRQFCRTFSVQNPVLEKQYGLEYSLVMSRR